MESNKKKLPWLLSGYAVAYLYIELAFGPHNRISNQFVFAPWNLAFTAAFLVWAGLWMKHEKPNPSRENRTESLFWLLCTVLLALSSQVFLMGDSDSLLSVLGFLALHAAAAYWVLCRSGLLLDGITGPCFLWDAFNAFVVGPFGHFFLRIRTLWQALWQPLHRRRAENPRRVDTKTAWATGVFIVFALGVLAFATAQLSAADAGFETMMASLLDGFRLGEMPEWLSKFFGRLVLSLPVGAYLYGMVGGFAPAVPHPETSVSIRREAENARMVSVTALTAVLAAFCALYLLFFYVQAGYLFGAFFGDLPRAFTYAGYARSGFFQLCVVMALNGGMLAAAAKCTKTPIRSALPLKAAALVLMGESLLLAATAFAKLAMYIYAYGFTTLRLLSSWAVVVLVAGTLLAMASIVKPRHAVREFIWFAAATFTLISFF